MAKKVKAIVKLQIPAGKATTGPPVGPSLAPHGINMMELIKAYNAATASQVGQIVPVEVTIYEDRSYSIPGRADAASGSAISRASPWCCASVPRKHGASSSEPPREPK